jgi:streptogramin lyase
LFAAAFCLLPGIEQASGAPVPGIDVTYTLDADFDKGTLMNLTYEGAHDQLQLSDSTTPFPFIYVANSGRGSIVRIDVNTGTILGEYYTSPSGMGKNPSRTTVDQFGNVWVSNRDENGYSEGKNKGSITRVGLIIGGTRVNADRSSNPTGQYLEPPFQYNTCVDRDGDGLIKTSRSANNRLAWSNAGGADTYGGVSTAEDECIINYTRVAATNTRTVAIDANNDVWVGGANRTHEKVSGITGEPIPDTEFNLGCGGYGGLVDGNGVLWSARYGSGLLRFDTKTMTGACLGTSKGDYGLAVDPNTGEIWHTFYSTGYVAKLAPDGTLLGKYYHGSPRAQGVVVDKSGNVWVAHSTSRSTVGHLRTNGTLVGTVSVGTGPTGVAIDANGKVWSTNYYAWTATRINPNAGSVGGGGFRRGAVDKTVSLGSSAYPYNYSDMTGYVAIGGTSPQGSWSVVQDSGAEGNKWGAVTWNREPEGKIPDGAIILVEARTSDTEAGLGGKNFTAVSNNQPFSLMGRYIEVRVTLKPNSSGEKPVLSDLRIRMTPINNVRVIDTISAGNIVIDPNSFTHQPYSITYGIDKSVIEWRFDAFSIGEIQDLAYTVSLKNPIPGEDRLVSHKLEVLYTDLDGNPVRNELGSQFVHVLNSKYASSLMADKKSYGPEENAAFSAEVTNLSQFAKTLDVKMLIEDGDGAAVQEIVVLPGVQFAAGETKDFSDLVFSTGANYAGSYRGRLLLYDGPNQVGTTSADFTILPGIAVSSGIVTDKISYQPNEQSTITATVKNQSVNYAMENLEARVTISSQGSEGTVQLYAGTKSIPVLMQGGSSTFTTYWNTGTNPAGTYLVTLEIFDAAGAVLSTSTVDLMISSTTNPVAHLKGQISLDNNSIVSGEPVTASYTVANAGNVDLSNIVLSVRTVDLEETVYDTISSQTALAMGATCTNSGQIDTQGFRAKDYLVVLQANIAGMEETLASTYFRVEDSTPPELRVDSPVEGEFYPDEVLFTVHATDTESGIDRVEYRLDEQESWNILTLSDSSADTYFARWETTYEDDGPHTVVVRALDLAGNSAVQTLAITVDNTAPVTSIAFENQSYIDGDKLLLTAASQVILTATDGLSGVAWTYYRYDDETDWRPYTGNIRITDLPFGPHVMHFYSEDRVDNVEAPQSVAFTLVGADVKVELLNQPRVLVWTDDPGGKKGGHGHCSVSYTLEDIRNLVAQAMDSADAYVELVTEEDDFRENFRSGIFNVVMVLSQKESVDSGFLRELREAVEQGRIGLLVSSWGNNVHPVLQGMFGVHFVGSMSMNEEQRELHLFDSAVARQTVLQAYGRILKTRLDGGILAGMIPGESRCKGLQSVSFSYPETLEAGDRVTVSVYTKGKKQTLVEQEQMTVAALPSEGVNNFTGNPAGDLAITSAEAEALSFTLAGPYGYLGSDYLLQVRIEHADGSVVESDLVAFTPTCDAHLFAGQNIGPFQVTAVDDDRVQISPDLPAAVLNQFGEGRTVFLAYDILESALKDDSGAHLGLLGNSANYLVPDATGPEPAGIGLIQTTVSFEGAGMDLIAIDTLDPGLTHLSLFGLKEPPLEYRFSLEDGTQAIYRYFVRFPDQIGDYAKKTELLLELEGTAVSYDAYEHVFTVAIDSEELLRQAKLMVEDLQTQNPHGRSLMEKIQSDLQAINTLRKSTRAEYEKVIGEVDQVIGQVEKLPFDTDGLLDVLASYRRIMQTLQIDAADNSPSGGHGHGRGWWRPKKREFYGPVFIDHHKRRETPSCWR